MGHGAYRRTGLQAYRYKAYKHTSVRACRHTYRHTGIQTYACLRHTYKVSGHTGIQTYRRAGVRRTADMWQADSVTMKLARHSASE